MKYKINNKGLTLIEIVVSMAIISIIAVSMLNIFGTGFSNIFRFGRNSKDYYEAAGELEISTLDSEYKGKQEALSITNEIVEIDVWGKTIKTRLIKSKIGDLNSALGTTDKYLFIYTVDPTLAYKPGQAFISISGNEEFQQGDIPISKELLEGKYRYNGKGRLIITSNASIVTDTINPINWEVKEGIYIKPGVNLDIKSVAGISLTSLNGNIIMNEVNINSGAKIAINSGKDFEARNTIIKSNLHDISIEAMGLIDLRGSDSKPTEISVKENINKIIFITKNKILLNNRTIFKKDGIEDWAMNKDDATLETANSIDGKKFK